MACFRQPYVGGEESGGFQCFALGGITAIKINS